MRRLAAGVVLAAPLAGLGQDLLWRGFDVDQGGFGCGDWGVAHTAEYVAGLDADGNAASGSLRVVGEFASPGEVSLQVCAGLTDVSPYKAVALDVYVDPVAAPGADGTYGTLTVRLRPNWAWPGDVISLGAVTKTGWTHLEKPLPATASAFSGLNIHWATTYSQQAAISLDKLTFVAKDTATIWRGFDTDVGGFGCGDWGVAHTTQHDPTIDSQSSPGSGSLMVEGQFTAPGEVSLQVCAGLPAVSQYDKIGLDVYVDAAATADANGGYGTFSIRLRPEWAWPGVLIELGQVTKTGWTHLEKPLPAGAAGFAGLNIHWATAHTATARVWLDNLAFISSGAPPPPPTIALAKSVPGLEVVTSGSGDYSRKNVATVPAMAQQISWVNHSRATRYSMTINEDVGPGAAGFSANLMLIGTEAETITTFPDWSEPNGIFLEAIPSAAGTINVSVRHKVDAPNAHGNRFTEAGLIIAANDTGLTSLVGTWTLTLEGAEVRLTGPGGVFGTGVLPAEVLPKFAGNLFAVFGAQPNTRKDRRISLARVQIDGGSGFAGNLDEDFTTMTALNPDRLELKEEDGGGVRLKPNNTVYRVSWPLPDAGFELRSSPTVLPGAWTALGLTPVQQGTFRTVYVTADKVTGNEQFFRLVK